MLRPLPHTYAVTKVAAGLLGVRGTKGDETVVSVATDGGIRHQSAGWSEGGVRPSATVTAFVWETLRPLAPTYAMKPVSGLLDVWGPRGDETVLFAANNSGVERTHRGVIIVPSWILQRVVRRDTWRFFQQLYCHSVFSPRTYRNG